MSQQQPSSPSDNQPEPISKNQRKTLKIILIVVGVFVALSIIGAILMIAAGAFLFHKATENIDISENGLTITGDDGESTLSTRQELPRDFPQDVTPIYHPSTIETSWTTREGNERTWSVQFSTSGTANEVFDFYETRAATNGWALESSAQFDTISSLAAEHTERKLSLSVQVIDATDADSVMFNLMVRQAIE